MLSAVASLLFLMAMFYAWQHFRSLQYGYQIEEQKTEHARLVELNRTLTLEQSQLRDPGRIDVLARQMDLEPPRPGQVVRLDSDEQGGEAALAQLSTIAVIPAQ
jgi:cell division protein FtsL